MSDVKTVQQQFNEQYRVAETMAQNMVRAFTDVAATSAEVYFDTLQKGMSYTLEFYHQSDKMTRDALQTYRQMYLDGVKTWQGYMQGMSEIATRR